MSKRNPTTELNHDNWDAEVDKEEAGRFKVASEDTIKKREIRVAKRRTGGGEENGTGGLFKSFTGFSGFGSAAPASGFAFGSQQQKTQSNDSVTNNNNNSGSSSNEKHLAQLKALNISVLNWIKQHVNDNAYCVLTPIFRDYERHLASIEEKYPYVEAANNVAASSGGLSTFKFSASVSPAASNDACKTQSPSADKSTAASAPAVSDSTSAATTTSSSATYSFTASAAPTAAASVGRGPSPAKIDFASSAADFKFNAKPPPVTDEQPKQQSALFGFSFGAGSSNAGSKPAFSLIGAGQQQQQQQQQQEEEEYEPPKPETREIKEDGAVYTKRCKLFYMQPDTKQWRDKGVGNVHVKPTDSAGKVQLIVRANNNLGTILLNTLVTKEMKLSVNKNNLNLACVPNPPLAGSDSKSDEPRLVPFLIKVKTEDDANEMLKSLDNERSGD